MGGKQLTRVKVEEIAKKANVSSATVSRVLNHPELVNERTKKNIIRIMRQMGYGAIQEERSKIILVLVPEAENDFYQAIYAGIYAAASHKDYQYIVRHCASASLPSEASIRELVYAVNTAGILLLAPATLEQLANLEKYAPVVQCCECVPVPDQFYVTIDDYRAAYNITAILIKNGRRRFGFVNHTGPYKYAKERRRGFEQALQDAGIALNPAWMVELNNYYFVQSHSILTQMFRAEETLPDAIVTVSDVYGAAAIKAAKECGLCVPGDVAITGFDNVTIGYITDPLLTTVSQPAFQMGNLACEILMNRIENPGYKPQQILLDTEIIVRGST